MDGWMSGWVILAWKILKSIISAVNLSWLCVHISFRYFYLSNMIHWQALKNKTKRKKGCKLENSIDKSHVTWKPCSLFTLIQMPYIEILKIKLIFVNFRPSQRGGAMALDSGASWGPMAGKETIPRIRVYSRQEYQKGHCKKEKIKCFMSLPF